MGVSYRHSGICDTVKPVCVKRPLKIDKTKILMTNGSLMKVKSIAICSPWGILQSICNTFDNLHLGIIGLQCQFLA